MTSRDSVKPVEINDDGSFNSALKRWSVVTAESMDLARKLSEFAIRHFEAHHDPIYLQRFFDAMPLNYARRSAFLTWVRKYTKSEGKTDPKNKDRRIILYKADSKVEWNIEAACKVPYWDDSPDKVVEEWDDATVVKFVNRFMNVTKKKDFPGFKTETAELSFKRAVDALKNWRPQAEAA